ncbi:sulfite exporter TauE/SafE family protein [Cryptosporangium japonicum]|uniref:Probable membrane transporter protein n=1 Tax=Cryptosporangium japonicum TaxID=80872 RepID=A0ABN0UBD6_9ACTN
MHLSLPAIGLLVVAGLAAGIVNGIAGGGSLLTFPALLVAGLPPVSANVTNSVSVAPGYLSSVYGSRRELRGQKRRILTLVPIAIVGAGAGCVLLLVTPGDLFEYIVPFLVLSATAVLAFQDALKRLTRKGKRVTMVTLTFLGSTYGGYFGAALGVVLVAVLALVLEETLQRVNALKNVLSATVGLVTVAVYALFGPVSWLGVAVTAPATIVGGYLGAKLAKKLSAQALKVTIVVFGTAIGLVLLYQAIW